MITIKYVSTDKWEKQFALEVRKNVHQYFVDKGISVKGNGALYLKTVCMLALYLVPFVLIMTLPMSAWLALPLAILMGVGMAGVGMCVMHDAVHGSYSKREWVNKLMGDSMYLLGSNVFNWKVQHNTLHHAYTNIEGFDEDINSKGPIRLSQYAPWRKIHRFQYIHAFFFYGLMTISKLVNDFTQLARYNREGITRKFQVNPTGEYFRMVAMKLAYLLVFIGLPLVLTGFSWWQVLLGFFIVHWTTGCILSTIFQMAHVVEGAEQMKVDASGTIQSEWAVHELKTTSDFAKNNRLLNWYVGGLNFQIEHHLFPNISHIHYRQLSPIVERTAHEFGLHYNLKPSFRKAFISHVHRLRELGRQPG